MVCTTSTGTEHAVPAAARGQLVVRGDDVLTASERKTASRAARMALRQANISGTVPATAAGAPGPFWGEAPETATFRARAHAARPIGD